MPDIDFAKEFLSSSKEQHGERMVEAKELRFAITTRLTKIEEDLAGKPGKMEVRLGLTFAGLMFAFMLVAFLADRGVNTHQTVQDTKELLK